MKSSGKVLYGNCDEFLYLRTATNNLHIKWFQNSYGKENIDLNTYGKSTGHSGSYSTNYQQTGRELLMADEVRMLDNDKAILLIRGEKPVIDFKYDILKHPNVKYRATGEIKELTEDELSELENVLVIQNFDNKDYNYELLSEEDIEEYLSENE